ncbi:AAA ATPase midasin [Tieghemiomyces parasiticus]|uniref:Midasin n=1 Tax=Tieghemiomyces parasiticus TaxID=78921 RepID=A0A9W7ZXJ3_9FUNG|nr:AAA ATPase midasin [Tieghemiomyces parasiticus]
MTTDFDPFRLDYLPGLSDLLAGGLNDALREVANPEDTLQLDTTAVLAQLAALQATFSAPSTTTSHHADSVRALDALSALLLSPSHTTAVALLFRPVLLDLIARWCLPGSHTAIFDQVPAADGVMWRPVDLAVVAFAQLLPNYPQAAQLAAGFFAGQPCPLTDLATGPHSPEARARLITAADRLLDLHPRLFRPLWNWGALETFVVDTTAGHLPAAIYYASTALARSLGAGSKEVTTVLDRVLAAESRQPFELAPFRTQERIQAERDLILTTNQRFFATPAPAAGPAWLLNTAALCPLTVSVSGVLLVRSPEPAVQLSATPVTAPLVLAPTTTANLRALALAASLGAPALLEGETGAGKTCLVEYLATATGHRLVKLHLGDQTDTKVLLGTYVTTSTPGEFRWQPGVLAAAVTAGWWILIEDVDLAPLDVVSALVPLLEERVLFVPGRGERLPAHHRFQLFATRRVTRLADGRAVVRPGASDQVLGQLWTTVEVHALQLDELTRAVAERYPRLDELSPHLVATFHAVRQATLTPAVAQSGGTVRVLSARDLFKWVHRVDAYYANVGTTAVGSAPITLTRDSQLALYQAGGDVFAEMVPSPAARLVLLQALGAGLGLTADTVEQWEATHRPALVTNHAQRLQIGRITLPVADGLVAATARDSSGRFAYTHLALRTLERLGAAVTMNEPVLLVGETGAGKTTAVQHLADLLHRPLHVINLSQQSDSADLLGGFKPVDARVLALPLKDTFEDLFPRTFSQIKNLAYLKKVREYFVKQQWRFLVQAFTGAVKLAEQRLQRKGGKAGGPDNNAEDGRPASKPKRARGSASPHDDLAALGRSWHNFADRVKTFAAQLGHLDRHLVFSFVEGTLVRSLRLGHWVLLDEMNLASAETLEALGDLLQHPTGSVLLTERGDVTPVPRHRNFRLFACINPATDVGKRDLPPGLRSRFTELYAVSPDARPDDLALIIRTYLTPAARGDPGPLATRVADFYRAAKDLAAAHTLVDGANQRPHYSVRSLARALRYVQGAVARYPLRRALHDGLTMTFVTQLAPASQTRLGAELTKHLGKCPALELPKSGTAGTDDGDDTSASNVVAAEVPFAGYFLPRGPELIDPATTAYYILTPSVRQHLADLARVTMHGAYPVLLQGPTSSGKTSMVEYLAKIAGHRFVRINNHEHTDLQEYLGSYVAEGERLVFREGALVQALRAGHWLVLDELNLAPSDVLEALNRLLDDNRELLLAETQEVIHPHPNFRLFATQNPAGLYGGRKALSRAFRNRFVELHFDDLPEDELETILAARCKIAPSYGRRMVQVYRKLTAARQTARVFESKHGFITLRDLFRWALRPVVGLEALASHGYMILAERVRRPADRVVVKQALEDVMRVTIDENFIYAVEDMPEYLAYQARVATGSAPPVAWTGALRRQFALVINAVRQREPVLLVGETGTGKTTVCQMLEVIYDRPLHILNCHQNTETADLLGGQRPARSRGRLTTQLHQELARFFHLAEQILKPSEASENEERVDDDLICQLDSVGLDTSCAGVEVAEEPVAVAELRTMDTDSGDEAEIDLNPEAVETTEARWDRFQAMVAVPEFPSDHLALQAAIGRLRDLHARAGALFEWRDGPLVQALRQGHLFLLDEIALADDSVLERLNSVLEPGCTLALAERGGVQLEELTGHADFRFLATMNPGGDYGKRELSPALRNRFTEIWVPPVTNQDDLLRIVAERLGDPTWLPYASAVLAFTAWFSAHVPHGPAAGTNFSLRDYLGWADFLRATRDRLPAPLAFVYGGRLTAVDGLGTHAAAGRFTSSEHLQTFRTSCHEQLVELASRAAGRPASELPLVDPTPADLSLTETTFGAGAFTIARGPIPSASVDFTFHAPTPFRNLMRLLGGLQIGKPLLLEGSPGVGKTSLVAALAAAAGFPLVRLNLSEQTDLADLFGADLPAESDDDVRGGAFRWCDAAFLRAMRDGHWVLLDEINLASQTVLEGLNACLDHRGTVYVPELDRSFPRHPTFRVFAAQNPLGQGGGRKGLPQSFVNRFTQIYVDALTPVDLEAILRHAHPSVPTPTLSTVLAFNQQLHEATMVRREFGQTGAPWEFNLRDVFRWLALLRDAGDVLGKDARPVDYLSILYLQRLRTPHDRQRARELFWRVATAVGQATDSDECIVADENRADSCEMEQVPNLELSPTTLRVGKAALPRIPPPPLADQNTDDLYILPGTLPALETLMLCVRHRWLPLLVGGPAVGKTHLVRLLSRLTGHPLREFAMNSAVDAMELLGGFEQYDLHRHRTRLVDGLQTLLAQVARTYLTTATARLSTPLADLWALHRRCVQAADPAAALRPIKRLLTLLHPVVSGLVQDGTLGPRLTALEMQHRDLAAAVPLPVQGRFEWIDGVLVEALERGDWLLIDNANLCSPSVLDRLNGLLEPNGNLALHERGLVDSTVRTIVPHPNFRLFMTCNPQFGELSRAMRNRGIEIALPANECAPNDATSTAPYQPADLARVLTAYALDRSSRGQTWLQAATTSDVGETRDALPPASLRDVAQLGRSFAERWQRGWPVDVTLPNHTTLSVHPALLLTAARLVAGLPAVCYEGLTTALTHVGHFFYLLTTPDAALEEALGDTEQLLPSPTPAQRRQAAAAELVAALPNVAVPYLRALLAHLTRPGHLSPALLATIVTPLGAALTQLASHPVQSALADYEVRVGASVGGCPHAFAGQHLKRALVEAPGASAAEINSAYAALLDTWRLTVNLTVMLAVERDEARAAFAADPTTWSATQRSLGFHAGRVPTAPPAVVPLAPYLDALAALLDEAATAITQLPVITLATPDIGCLWDLLRLRARLADLGRASGLEMSAAADLGRRLIAAFEVLRGLPWATSMAAWSVATEAGATFVSAVGLRAGELAGRVWTEFHPVPLTAPELLVVHDRIIEVNRILADSPAARQWLRDPLSTSAAHVVAARRDLVTAHATLYALEAQCESDRPTLLTPLVATIDALATQFTPSEEAHDGVSHHSTQDVKPEDKRKEEEETTADHPFLALLDYFTLALERRVVTGLRRWLVLAADADASDTIRSDLVRDLRDLLQYGLQVTTRDPLTLTAHQRTLWLLEADARSTDLHPLLTELTAAAGDRLWTQRPTGPAALTRDAVTQEMTALVVSLGTGPADQLAATRRQLAHVRTPLEAFATYFKDPLTAEATDLLLIHLHLLRWTAGGQPSPAHDLTADHVLDTLLSLSQARCSTKSEPLDVDLAVYTHLGDAPLPTEPGLSLRTSLDHTLKACAAIARHEPATRHLGQAYFALGLGLANLLVPETAVDPAMKQLLAWESLFADHRSAQADVDTAAGMQIALTGHPTSMALRQYQLRLDSVIARARTLPAARIQRPDPAAFAQVFRDTRHLLQNVLGTQSLSPLLTQLTARIDSHFLPPAATVERLAFVQDTLHHLLGRLSARYPTYRDVIVPLQAFVRHAQHGLAYLAVPTSTGTTPEAGDNLAYDLLAFPFFGCLRPRAWLTMAISPERLAVIRSQCLADGDEGGLKKYLAILRTLLYWLRTRWAATAPLEHATNDLVEARDALFAQVQSVWHAVAERRRERAREEGSLYKTRPDHFDAEDPEAAEARELQTLFPSYAEEFSEFQKGDGEGASDSAMAPVELAKRQLDAAADLDADVLADLVSLHRDLYLRPAPEVSSDPHRLRTVLRVYTAVGEGLLPAADLPASAAQRLIPAHLAALNAVAPRNASGPETPGLAFGRYLAVREPGDRYDFYADPHLNETSTFAALLGELDARLVQLQAAWPEQPVLARLRDLVTRLRSQPASSPLAKWLTGVELFLTQAQDWELYASREFALRPWLDRLSQVVVHWRQLELECWPHLLEGEFRRHRRRAHVWWLHLYNLVIAPLVPSEDREADDEDADRSDPTALLTTLVSFLRTSTLGEFAARLELLRAFAKHLATVPSTTSNSSIGPLLDHVIHYYSVYEAPLAAERRQGVQPVAKELTDFVRIATFKDVNVHALRASAQKTHRELHKCLQKVRAVLNTPVDALITRVDSRVLLTVSETEAAASADPSDTALLPAQMSSKDARRLLLRRNRPTTSAPTIYHEFLAGVESQMRPGLQTITDVVDRLADTSLDPLSLTSQVIAAVARPRYDQWAPALRRLQRLVADGGLYRDTLPISRGVAAFAHHAVIRMTDLKNSAPTVDPEKDVEAQRTTRAQFYRRLKVIKQKTLTDYVRQLKRLGLKPRPRPDIRQRLQPATLFSTPYTDLEGAFFKPLALVDPEALTAHPQLENAALAWQRADQQYPRLLARLTLVQQAPSSPVAPDLPPGTTERLVGYSESAVDGVILLRDRLRTLAPAVAQVTLLTCAWAPAVATRVSCAVLAPGWFATFRDLASYVAMVHESVGQTVEILEANCKPEGEAPGFLRCLRQLYSQAAALTATLTSYVTQLHSLGEADPCFAPPGILAVWDETFTFLRSLPAEATELLVRNPDLRGFLEPMVSSLSGFLADHHDLSTPTMIEPVAIDAADAAPCDSGTLPPSLLTAARALDSLVDGLLIAFQAIRLAAPANELTQDRKMEGTDDEDDADGDFLPDEALTRPHQQFANLKTALALDQVTRNLIQVTMAVRTALLDPLATPSIQAYLRRALAEANAFVAQYVRLAQHAVVDLVLYHGAAARVAYLLTTAAVHLLRDGFCTPAPEEDGEAGDDGADGEAADGTGMGEGTGEKNVSDEIENEDQVEGTKDEEKDDKANDPNRDREGEDIEMEQDFDGDLGDADLTDADDQSDGDEEDDEEPELSEQIGDVDLNDPTAVDDKLWDDDAPDDQDPAEAQLDPNQATTAGEQETVAKEEEDGGQDDKKDAQQKKKEEEKEDPNQPPSNEGPEDGTENEPGDEDAENSEPEDELGAEMNPDDLAPMDPKAGDTMDLPDDLGMPDPENEQEGEDQEDGAEEPEGPDDGADDPRLGDEAGPTVQPPEDEAGADGEGPDDEVGNAAEPDRPLDDAMDQDGDEADPEVGAEDDDSAEDSTRPDPADEQGDAPAEQPEPEETPQDEEDETAAAAGEAGENAMDEDQPGEQPDEDNAEAPKAALNDHQMPETYGVEEDGDEGQAQEAIKAQPQAGQGTDDDEKEKEDGKEDDMAPRSEADRIDRPDARQGESSAQDTADTQATREAAQDAPAQESDDVNATERHANPYRSLADATESWSRRLHLTERPEDTPAGDNDPTRDEPETKEAEPEAMDVDGAFEYTREDEQHAHAALADAPVAEAPQADGEIGHAPQPDETDRSLPEDTSEPLEVDTEEARARLEALMRGEDPDGTNGTDDEGQAAATAAHALDGALLQNGPAEDSGLLEDDDQPADPDPTLLNHAEEEPAAEEARAEATRQALARATEQLKAAGPNLTRDAALTLWQRYEALTHDLALSLCEQLRLILEPTLATQLRGDYRTGKRLNMRKIIPYIASEYKKDKIWLRRTKPSKRQYQILIAVDDSKSMAGSRAVELAFETLALTTRALTQLEAGSLAVARFGHRLDVLHPFDTPFTSDTGAALLTDFTFQQTRTNVAHMLDESLDLFDDARQAAGSTGGGSAADLWQLHLILSDGVCEDHDRLRALVRRGAERRVMVLFIVLDNKPANQSILELNHVAYETVDGVQRLRMARYLDSFPFTYYLVLRDIKALPSVLADALRQYFSLVAEQ